MIRPRPNVSAMAAYALPDLSVPAGLRPVILAQNEALMPPSPRAIAAGTAALARAHRYPDPDLTELRGAIAAVHGLEAHNILFAAGSMDLIWALIQTFCGPGDAVLAPAYCYLLFRTATQAAGAGYLTASEADFTVDVDALLAAVTPAVRVVCLANPGNPTGTTLPVPEVARLRAGLPDDVLLVIDEAYGEFAEAGAAFGLVARGDTVVLRTFSKAYGLAGARVGWGLFPPDVGAEVRKMVNPNSISAAAQAMAMAAVWDQAYMRELLGQTAAVRDGFAQRLTGAGFAVVPSRTNFLLIDFGQTGRAAGAAHALRSRGLVARPMGGYGLPHCLRISIGPRADMEDCADILIDWKDGGKRR